MLSKKIQRLQREHRVQICWVKGLVIKLGILKISLKPVLAERHEDKEKKENRKRREGKDKIENRAKRPTNKLHTKKQNNG